MKTKLISVALAALTAASIALTSCGERDPLKSSGEDKKIVMTVSTPSATERVKFQEYRYFWMNNKRDLYGEAAELTPEQTEKLKTLVENNISDRHALRLLAAEQGITLTSEDEMRTAAYVDSFKTDCGGEEGYAEQLAAQYLNDPLFRELTADTTIAYALLDEMANNGSIAVGAADFEEALNTDEILCLKEIYVTYPTAETKDWAKGHIEEAMQRLEAGESFESLMLEYSSYDPAELPPEHGYYTMEYDALDEVWSTAASLEEGEYSEIVESAFGFHIIMRAEKDVDYVESEIRDELYETFRQSRFYQSFYDYKSTVTVEYKEFDLPTE